MTSQIGLRALAPLLLPLGVEPLRCSFGHFACAMPWAAPLANGDRLHLATIRFEIRRSHQSPSDDAHNAASRCHAACHSSEGFATAATAAAAPSSTAPPAKRPARLRDGAGLPSFVAAAASRSAASAGVHYLAIVIWRMLAQMQISIEDVELTVRPPATAVPASASGCAATSALDVGNGYGSDVRLRLGSLRGMRCDAPSTDLASAASCAARALNPPPAAAVSGAPPFSAANSARSGRSDHRAGTGGWELDYKRLRLCDLSISLLDSSNRGDIGSGDASDSHQGATNRSAMTEEDEDDDSYDEDGDENGWDEGEGGGQSSDRMAGSFAGRAAAVEEEANRKRATQTVLCSLHGGADIDVALLQAGSSPPHIAAISGDVDRVEALCSTSHVAAIGRIMAPPPSQPSLSAVSSGGGDGNSRSHEPSAALGRSGFSAGALACPPANSAASRAASLPAFVSKSASDALKTNPRLLASLADTAELILRYASEDGTASEVEAVEAVAEAAQAEARSVQPGGAEEPVAAAAAGVSAGRCDEDSAETSSGRSGGGLVPSVACRCRVVKLGLLHNGDSAAAATASVSTDPAAECLWLLTAADWSISAAGSGCVHTDGAEPLRGGRSVVAPPVETAIRALQITERYSRWRQQVERSGSAARLYASSASSNAASAESALTLPIDVTGRAMRMIEATAHNTARGNSRRLPRRRLFCSGVGESQRLDDKWLATPAYVLVGFGAATLGSGSGAAADGGDDLRGGGDGGGDGGSDGVSGGGSGGTGRRREARRALLSELNLAGEEVREDSIFAPDGSCHFLDGGGASAPCARVCLGGLSSPCVQLAAPVLAISPGAVGRMLSALSACGGGGGSGGNGDHSGHNGGGGGGGAIGEGGSIRVHAACIWLWVGQRTDDDDGDVAEDGGASACLLHVSGVALNLSSDGGSGARSGVLGGSLGDSLGSRGDGCGGSVVHSDAAGEFEFQWRHLASWLVRPRQRAATAATAQESAKRSWLSTLGAPLSSNTAVPAAVGAGLSSGGVRLHNGRFEGGAAPDSAPLLLLWQEGAAVSEGTLPSAATGRQEASARGTGVADPSEPGVAAPSRAPPPCRLYSTRRGVASQVPRAALALTAADISDLLALIGTLSAAFASALPAPAPTARVEEGGKASAVAGGAGGGGRGGVGERGGGGNFFGGTTDLATSTIISTPPRSPLLPATPQSLPSHLGAVSTTSSAASAISFASAVSSSAADRPLPSLTRAAFDRAAILLLPLPPSPTPTPTAAPAACDRASRPSAHPAHPAHPAPRGHAAEATIKCWELSLCQLSVTAASGEGACKAGKRPGGVQGTTVTAHTAQVHMSHRRSDAAARALFYGNRCTLPSSPPPPPQPPSPSHPFRANLDSNPAFTLKLRPAGSHLVVMPPSSARDAGARVDIHRRRGPFCAVSSRARVRRWRLHSPPSAECAATAPHLLRRRCERTRWLGRLGALGALWQWHRREQHWWRRRRRERRRGGEGGSVDGVLEPRRAHAV